VQQRDNETDIVIDSAMTPEETQALQTHLEAAAAILFKNTPAEKLQNFQSIERSVREQVQEHISPEMGNFFTQRYSNNSRT